MADAPDVTKVVFPENLERFKGNQDEYNTSRFSLKTHEVRPATAAEIDAAIGEVTANG